MNDIPNRATDAYVKSLKEIEVLKQNGSESKTLKFLSSQMKQAIAKQVKRNLATLNELKKKGHKIGKLKFKSFLNSINLKQYKSTYKINFQQNKISLQRMKKAIKVNGLKQIHELSSKFPDLEIANAKLLKSNGDYFLNITLYHTDSEKRTKLSALIWELKSKLV